MLERHHARLKTPFAVLGIRTLGERVTDIEYLPVGAATLLAALAATAALSEAGGFAGYARPAGVLVGLLLAWRRAPFVLVVVAAAATTAVLRLLGVA